MKLYDSYEYCPQYEEEEEIVFKGQDYLKDAWGYSDEPWEYDFNDIT